MRASGCFDSKSHSERYFETRKLFSDKWRFCSATSEDFLFRRKVQSEWEPKLKGFAFFFTSTSAHSILDPGHMRKVLGITSLMVGAPDLCPFLVILILPLVCRSSSL